MMTGVIVVLASVAAFLAAAKSYGRQLRLEREVAGYWEVRFGGTNPPFVAAWWLVTLVLIAAVGWAVRGARPSA